MRIALRLLVSFILAGPAAAADHVLTLEPAHAKVTFFLGATGHDVEGSFPLTKCEVHFDPETGAASGEISLDAADGVTGNPKRDRTMREKVLEATTSPTIVFHPTRFDGKLPDSGEGDVKLEGSCTIAGADHPLTLAAHVDRNGDALHVLATFAVPYVAWGMTDPSVMFLKVDKSVQMTVDGDATLTTVPAITAPAATTGR